MKREIVITADGSFTLKVEGTQECYHSVNGAYTESMHIFIQNGLKYYITEILKNTKDQSTDINILEVGFGTGLNSILTAITIKNYPNIRVNYNAVEKYPLTLKEFESLNYKKLIDLNSHFIVAKIHSSNWGRPLKIEDNFTLLKINYNIEDFQLNIEEGLSAEKGIKLINGNSANIVYFDAFSPNIQPELWSSNIFKGIYNLMSDNSILVTYSAKGDVKRALREAGFNVTRKEGPPGKRHITVARKIVEK